MPKLRRSSLRARPNSRISPERPTPATRPRRRLPLRRSRPKPRPCASKLDASKLDLDQKEAALNGRDLSDAELQGLRQGIDPIAESLRALVADLAPKLDAAKARLEQLGPKPKEDDPDESADVARDRAERESAVAELDETQRLARAVLIQAEQLTAQVSDRRRAALHARAVRADLQHPEPRPLGGGGAQLSARPRRSGHRRAGYDRALRAEGDGSASCSCWGSPSASPWRSSSGGAISRRAS